MMEIASTNYLDELVDVMEDYPTSFDEYPMLDCFAYTHDDEFQSLSSGSPDHQCYSSNPYFNNHHQFVAPPTPPRPTKKLKTFETTMPPPTSSQLIISFENSSSEVVASKKFGNLTSAQVVKKKKIKQPKVEKNARCGENHNIDFAALISHGAAYDDDFEDNILLNYYDYSSRKYKAATTARNPVQAQEHVISERKRREKLSQRFVALSAMVPGLKKMDKASILGDAIKYVKQLEERLQTLEEQAAKPTVESAVLVKRCFMFVDENNNCNSQFEESSSTSSSLPEMQARVCGKEVLIRIHCKKENGREAAAILTELEKHHLTLQTTTCLPFGNNTLDITVLAQMNEEYFTTAKELLGSLRLALTHTSS